MKAMSIRLNVYQHHWLKAQAKVRGIYSADYVRELIDKQMQEPHFFEYLKSVEEEVLIPTAEKPIVIYMLRTCKLMEQLLLNEEEGRQKCEMAYLAAEEWLADLKVYPERKKNYRLSLMLHPEQLDWVNEQAKMLKKSPLAIIRKIIFLASNTAQKHPPVSVNSDLTETQKAELKAVLMTFTLLKTYIISAYEEGEKLLKSAHEGAESLYNKLYI
jgi:predicted DNA-binding protein